MPSRLYYRKIFNLFIKCLRIFSYFEICENGIDVVTEECVEKPWKTNITDRGLNLWNITGTSLLPCSSSSFDYIRTCTSMRKALLPCSSSSFDYIRAQVWEKLCYLVAPLVLIIYTRAHVWEMLFFFFINSKSFNPYIFATW